MHHRNRKARAARRLLAGALLALATTCGAGARDASPAVPPGCEVQVAAPAAALPREPTQRVVPVPSRVAVRVGDELRVRLDSQVLGLDPARPVAGLGLRLHFDGRALALLRVGDVLAAARVGADRAAQPDVADADADARTDSVLQFAWADLGGRWDVGRDGPVTVVELVFVAGPHVGATDLHVTSAGTAPAMAFASPAVRICVRDLAPER